MADATGQGSPGRDYTNWDTHGNATDPLRCHECDRPMYYDPGDESYHHAVEASRGCFLIGAEDRPDDLLHPIVKAEAGR